MNGTNTVVEFNEIVSGLRSDLELVESRLSQAANVEFPFVGELLQAIIGAGGKRLRPVLLMLSCKSFIWDEAGAIPAAAGVEMLHTASLVHDDTIDHALLRRGTPTLNSHLKPETVILFGDYLFAQSAILATETMNPRVVSVFASSLADICDGQLHEIFSSGSTSLTIEEYERRIFGKTASLFAASAEMGAILGQANDDQIQQMRSFGADVGMAFQIVDDIMDIRSSTEEIGKPAGQDLREGTVTLPTMLFLQNADGSPSAQLVRNIITGDDTADQSLNQAVVAIRESTAISESLVRARTYVDQAKSRLICMRNGHIAAQLEAFADYTLSRTI